MLLFGIYLASPWLCLSIVSTAGEAIIDDEFASPY